MATKKIVTKAENNFEKLLNSSSKEIIGRRGKIASENFKESQRRMLEDLKGSKRKLDLKLLDLMDINPTSKVSLAVLGKDVEPEAILEDIQRTKEALKLIELKLSCSQETWDEWFAPINGSDE